MVAILKAAVFSRIGVKKLRWVNRKVINISAGRKVVFKTQIVWTKHNNRDDF